jgi:glutathione synthase/RimK-type ligase-like ATP-grasp enzyme
MKQKPKLGIICTMHGNKTEKSLFPALSRYFELVLFPVQQDIDYDIMEKRIRCARLVLNTAIDWPNSYDSIEIAKMFEGLGKKVIDSSRSFYYHEDKWMFYQTCLKHHLPTPVTYYIPRNIGAMRSTLRHLAANGPLVFKGVFSDTGRAVKRAMNYEEALRVIKGMHKKAGNMPLIAQRYVPHGKTSYRVTLAGSKIIQAITKYGKNWKEGKLFWKNEKYRLFRPDKKLAALCRKTAKAFGIEWCGIDLMKDSNDNWQLIEVNSGPSMDFVLSDMKRANTELAKYLSRLNAGMQK